MAGFVEGVDRGQSTLFPALLDDYVAEDMGGSSLPCMRNGGRFPPPEKARMSADVGGSNDLEALRRAQAKPLEERYPHLKGFRKTRSLITATVW